MDHLARYAAIWSGLELWLAILSRTAGHLGNSPDYCRSQALDRQSSFRSSRRIVLGHRGSIDCDVQDLDPRWNPRIFCSAGFLPPASRSGRDLSNFEQSRGVKAGLVFISKALALGNGSDPGSCFLGEVVGALLFGSIWALQLYCRLDFEASPGAKGNACSITSRTQCFFDAGYRAWHVCCRLVRLDFEPGRLGPRHK